MAEVAVVFVRRLAELAAVRIGVAIRADELA
jgi:hypothetical protein